MILLETWVLEFRESREIEMGISNLIDNFATSVELLTSVLILELHSFRTFQLKAFQPKLSNFSILPTALSNFMSAGSQSQANLFSYWYQ